MKEMIVITRLINISQLTDVFIQRGVEELSKSMLILEIQLMSLIGVT